MRRFALGYACGLGTFAAALVAVLSGAYTRAMSGGSDEGELEDPALDPTLARKA